MRKRVITASCLFVIITTLLIFDNQITKLLYLILMGFISYVGTYEYINGAFKKTKSEVLKKYRFILPIFSCLLALSIPWMFLLNKSDYIYITRVFIFLLLLLFITIMYFIIIFTGKSTGHDLETFIFGLVYGGLFVGTSFSIRFYIPINNISFLGNINGIKLFIFVYTIVFMTDTFAFFIGNKWGKTKIAPNISPNKTLAGSVGGSIIGAISGLICLFIIDVIPLEFNSFSSLLMILVFLVVCFALSVTVQIGDLVESKLKRTFEIKDFGNILPGHGGILDRFDSFILTSSVVVIALQIYEFILILIK